jgi:hypothetical protein
MYDVSFISDGVTGSCSGIVGDVGAREQDEREAAARVAKAEVGNKFFIIQTLYKITFIQK